MPAGREILVVGAGPVGLTAALELARRGFRLRIIDAGSGPSPESRALAVNPRTLEILEPSGATGAMLAEGLEVRRINFWDPPKLIFSVPIDRLEHRYNFILALPQDRTERILMERLAAHDIAPERQTALTALSVGGASCDVTISRGDTVETARYDIVIGADGAHSTVREELGIGFHGSSYDEDFGLADVDLAGHPAAAELNVYLVETGLVGLIPIGGTRYRIVSDQPDVFAALPDIFEVGAVHWQSRFRISHRQVETYQNGPAFLAGDAAHIHSPAGGRGMNLGIEDAATLAWLIDTDGTDSYTSRRLPVGRHVLRQTDLQTRFMTSRNPWARFLRRNLMPLILRSDFVLRRALPEMAGLAAPAPPWLAGG